MPEDSRAYKRNIQIKYSEEISEHFRPEGGLAQPVLSPVEYVKTERRKLNKVFYFLCCTSLVCLGALVLAPLPEVQVASSAVWTGAVALSWRLLKAAYRSSD